jgi:medium-chain acyl-[acyl-carrier-protein] hydrolase
MIDKNSWIVRHTPLIQPSLRLFCFPYAGAGSSIFRTWGKQFPSDIEICAIQLPGRENRIREPLIENLSSLSENLLPALLPYLDRPFAFFGHSLGALICFELSRQLKQQNAPTPLHLFVSARHAPQIPSKNKPIHQLPDIEFIEALRCYNGTPKSILQNAELMSILIEILRADLKINETYIYTQTKPFNFPISAFGGLKDNLVNIQALQSWSDRTTNKFTLRMYPGDHFFLKEQQDRILQAIAEDLLVLS